MTLFGLKSGPARTPTTHPLILPPLPLYRLFTAHAALEIEAIEASFAAEGVILVAGWYLQFPATSQITTTGALAHHRRLRVLCQLKH
jgi:hypothetical protein